MIRRMTQGEMMVWAAAYARDGGGVAATMRVLELRGETAGFDDENQWARHLELHNHAFFEQMRGE